MKNKCSDGKYNICGKNIKQLRLEMSVKTSQRAVADKLQLCNLDIDKNAIQRIESGERFVTDIELLAIAKLFNVSLETLLKE